MRRWRLWSSARASTSRKNMPLREYFKGRGRSVARRFQQRYGADWKRVFYATANKRGLAPKRRKTTRARPNSPAAYHRKRRKG